MNTIELYKTHTMLAALKQMPPNPTFLRDRYFPCNPARDMFSTEEVLVEYMDGDQKMAPCVLPRKGGVVMSRAGFVTKRYAPPNVAPKRTLTIDDLMLKGFGEGLYSELTPAQREGAILGQDLQDLDRFIDRREEYIAAQLLLNNGYTLRHYEGEYGSSRYEEWEIRFYDGENDTATYTPAVAWDETGGDFMADMRAMIKMQTTRGLAVSELLMGAGVSDTIIYNEKFQKLMDIKNYSLGQIAPLTLPNGAAHIGTINIDGHMIKLLTYDGTFEDEDGTIKSYIPSDTVILTAPNCGRSLYGAVTQVEQEGLQTHTYTGRRIPKYLVDPVDNVKTLTLTSRPLPIPKAKDAWVHAKVL